MLAKYVESDEFEKCPKPQTMISAFVQKDFWAPRLSCVNLPVERDYGGDTRNHDNPRAKRLAWECSSFQWVVVFDAVPAILGIRLPL